MLQEPQEIASLSGEDTLQLEPVDLRPSVGTWLHRVPFKVKVDHSTSAKDGFEAPHLASKLSSDGKEVPIMASECSDCAQLEELEKPWVVVEHEQVEMSSAAKVELPIACCIPDAIKPEKSPAVQVEIAPADSNIRAAQGLAACQPRDHWATRASVATWAHPVLFQRPASLQEGIGADAQKVSSL